MIIIYDGLFSIDIGLELAGVAGLFVGLDRYTTWTKRVVRRECVGRLSDA